MSSMMIKERLGKSDVTVTMPPTLTGQLEEEEEEVEGDPQELRRPLLLRLKNKKLQLNRPDSDYCY